MGVKKTGPSGNAAYLYNENGQLIAEHNTAGVVQKEYVYLNAQVVGLIKANTLQVSGSGLSSCKDL